METKPYSCTRVGRTNSEKTMEDGNTVNTKDDKITTTTLKNLYSERPTRLSSNGHDFAGESSSPPDERYDQCRLPADTSTEEKFKKRINPLRIHLGKRPFVDNSLQYYNPSKKRKPSLNKNCDSSASVNSLPRVPKLVPKHIDRNQFHNVSSVDSDVNSERDKPVPRLVPKSQYLQFKKGKTEKGSQLKEYAQSLGLQPMVKFKCRKCCSMSFKTLAMLKEHQLVCRAQAKEPALSPEAAAPSVNEANNGGPSRVTRKVYLCSACGTYYENWNLFLHMREVHNRHICLFCLGMFSKAEKLSAHLTNKHNVKEFSYNSKEDFFNVYSGTFYLMCCACDEICSEQDDFFHHDCNNVKPKPVPVLISKNAAKASGIKNTKNYSDTPISSNGPSSISKEPTKPYCDKKDIIENKLETVTSSTHKLDTSCGEFVIGDTSISSDSSATTSKDAINSADSGMELESPETKQELSPIHQNAYSPESTKHMISNGGNDSLEHSEESDSPVSDEHDNEAVKACSANNEEIVGQPVEKECGIKLKLSLNNASSPVIINSTVDPTIGQQKVHKPPSRVRRPPKRYEREIPPETIVPPKPPSIKMTICDRADSPFVKTTIFENNKETTLRTLLNNNVDSVSKIPESKPENTVKTTIYDNNLEDTNTLNRVPKLTVRVPKELLDKDSSSDYSSDSDVSDKLTVDEHNTTLAEKDENSQEPKAGHLESEATLPLVELNNVLQPESDENIKVDDESKDVQTEPKTEAVDEVEMPVEPIIGEPTIPVTELSLDKPLDRYPLKELLKVFLASTIHNCIYCNHVRKIAVNCEQLALHMTAQHRFRATVDSITAEELMPETITAKLTTTASELSDVFINLDSYDSVDKCEDVQYDYMFECFQCYFKTAIHKDLCLHNRKMHQKTILLCVMCKSNFFSYSELICHLCPGTYDSEYEIKFRCCLCSVDTIPSQFRLMVHMRKIHHTCDVCLELCHNQARLSNHVWKHKLHHLCYRCGIAYRNKPDITNHLFWKHGTESVMCKKCMQKKWPHVYHFCTPPAIFICEECSLQFTKAVYLKVHKRFHSEEYPHICTEVDCSEKFVSKKLLSKHLDDHKNKLMSEDLNNERQLTRTNETLPEASKEPIPIIDLVSTTTKEEAGSSDVKAEPGTEKLTKKEKKKKLKHKDALLLDVNLPALNLSESDSSDESDSGNPPPALQVEKAEEKPKDETFKTELVDKNKTDNETIIKVEEKIEPLDEKPNDQQVLDIWDNFKKYQEKVEKQKEKTPPLVPIRKHVCESDHDYCLIPIDMNGDDDLSNSDKKKNKKSPKKSRGGLSSSSSSSSDSDSSCSCGSNCSCSSSSGSSSSSSSDSDSSDDSGNVKKKIKRIKKILPNRKLSTGSNVDVMGMSETPILIPEKSEPPIAETDLETDESETDEEFYDENPQQIANKLNEEKRIQLMTMQSVGPSDAVSSPPCTPTPIATTPIKEEDNGIKEESIHDDIKIKSTSAKKKSKKKKRSKNSRKHGPIKINIPKDVITKSEVEPPIPLVPNKITISLQSNTVQIPEAPKLTPSVTAASAPQTSAERKRASKRRRVPNKFYGYSSDEEAAQTPVTALKPQQPPKLEWRKEDLPSPVTHKTKKEVPSTIIPSRLFNYTDPIRLTAPIPDPEPPRILMNTESMESSDSDSSDEGHLEIYQPNQSSVPPPPTYLNSGTSSLPYAFQRPAVREAREGESVYCYCRCPYDEVSEMIACDAEGCPIEWFHFECVGIMVPPKGKWYCPECRKNQSFSGYR